ncbi:MAG: hypothetical protein II954_07775 [Synergistaceae bacterium]|nr:hypothetical protein [Synergistaceae bacterium]
MTIQEINQQFSEVIRILEHRAEELRLQEHLKDIDARRTDWERRTALFVPSRQKLERGGKTLELGQEYETIKELRQQREQQKLRQSSLREDMTEARTELQNAEEALALIESQYRDKLTEQTKLEGVAQRVRTLDKQIVERTEAASQVRKEFEEAEQNLKECSERADSEQKALERVEVALREARKFLQLHSTDEKLRTGLAGIQKCFAMYSQAEEKRTALRESLGKAIDRRQNAQSTLNDRSALLSEVSHRFSVAEKTYARARAFYESTLKGKSIAEWREICSHDIKRLEELDELYKKFQHVSALEERLKILQDSRLRIQQEARSLNIRDVEQAGRIHELQDEAARLEKRAALLRRIEDLDAVRELLQDNAPCPLCGAMTHPYTSGVVVPDPEEVHRQLAETQEALNELRDQLTTRQTRAGKLSEEITLIGSDESDLRKEINELNAEISSKVSILGLKFGAGISPFEELDRARQRTRDSLQLARNAADTAESAERDMKAAADELEKLRASREEISKIYQDALFSLQSGKSDEEQINTEGKTQEEIVSSLKRELISQVMPYGYKTLPDKNPGELVDSLARRLDDWLEGARRSDELERELSVAQTRMNAVKKERESLRQKREELASRVKASEAERDSVRQQRVILFESRDPDSECSRMSQDVSSLREQLNERREAKTEKAAKLDRVMSELHTLETEMAKGREDIQKHEINFNKRLLALGFRNEEDYSAACLTSEERRDLQGKLRELNETDFELNTERENTKAKIIDLQAEGVNLTNDEITRKLRALKSTVDELRLSAVNGPDDAAFREKLSSEYVPKVRDLALTCGLEEVF